MPGYAGCLSVGLSVSLRFGISTSLSNPQPVLGGSHPNLSSGSCTWLLNLTQDTLGFAGMKMIRRVVGISHVEDLDGIKDTATRAECESHALALGKRLVILSGTPYGNSDGSVAKVGHVCDLARSLGSSSSSSSKSA